MLCDSLPTLELFCSKLRIDIFMTVLLQFLYTGSCYSDGGLPFLPGEFDSFVFSSVVKYAGFTRTVALFLLWSIFLEPVLWEWRVFTFLISSNCSTYAFHSAKGGTCINTHCQENLQTTPALWKHSHKTESVKSIKAAGCSGTACTVL